MKAIKLTENAYENLNDFDIADLEEMLPCGVEETDQKATDGTYLMKLEYSEDLIHKCYLIIECDRLN